MRLNHTQILNGLLTILVLVLIFGLGAIVLLRIEFTQRYARTELNGFIENNIEFPIEITIVGIVSLDFSHDVSGNRCFYAQDNLVLGSTQPESEAMEALTGNLLSSGWILGPRQYPTTTTLYFGDNIRAVVRVGEPGVDVRDSIDFAQLQHTFESIIFVGIDYMIPQRESC